MSSVIAKDIVQAAKIRIDHLIKAARNPQQVSKIKAEISKIMLLFVDKILAVAKEKLPHAQINSKEIDEIKQILTKGSF